MDWRPRDDQTASRENIQTWRRTATQGTTTTFPPVFCSRSGLSAVNSGRFWWMEVGFYSGDGDVVGVCATNGRGAFGIDRLPRSWEGNCEQYNIRASELATRPMHLFTNRDCLWRKCAFAFALEQHSRVCSKWCHFCEGRRRRLRGPTWGRFQKRPLRTTLFIIRIRVDGLTGRISLLAATVHGGLEPCPLNHAILNQWHGFDNEGWYTDALARGHSYMVPACAVRYTQYSEAEPACNYRNGFCK